MGTGSSPPCSLAPTVRSRQLPHRCRSGRLPRCPGPSHFSLRGLLSRGQCAPKLLLSFVLLLLTPFINQPPRGTESGSAVDKFCSGPRALGQAAGWCCSKAVRLDAQPVCWGCRSTPLEPKVRQSFILEQDMAVTGGSGLQASVQGFFQVAISLWKRQI